MKRQTLHLLLTILLLPCGLRAQNDPELLIRMEQVTVDNDSLRLEGLFHLPLANLPSAGKRIFALSLEYEGRQLDLPPVVIGGKRRLRYERREQVVNPGLRPEPAPAVTLLSGGRKPSVTEVRYQAAVPYAAWMQHAALRLEQWVSDCCHEKLVASDLLQDDIDLDYDCGPIITRQSNIVVQQPATITQQPPVVLHQTDTVYIEQPQEQPPLCLECTTVYIDFPQGSFRVMPGYKANRRELLKIDSLMEILPVAPFTLDIVSFASPEGTTAQNELLAYRRMKGITDYINNEWILPTNCRLSPRSQGEDWEGLLVLLRRTRKPYAATAAAIIRENTRPSERKRLLTELDGGAAWNDMLIDLFPLLRRIELKIIPENE